MRMVILTRNFEMNDFKSFESCHNSFYKRAYEELFVILEKK